MRIATGCVVFPIFLVSNALGELAKPVRILEDDIPHWAPFFADIDGDGKNDLLVGQFRDGPFTDARVMVYRNTGTNQKPVFGDGTWMQAGNADATVDEFCFTGFGPQVIDFDGDGIRDLISASRASLLSIFAGRDDGTFDFANAVQYVPDDN